MDSYIVRIYRRQTTNPHELVGVVEDVELEETMAFKSVDELWEILAEHKDRLSPTRGKRQEKTTK